jgi:ribose/xylose/arabinose/galactoside ABC-type transport system permease subunit
VIGCVLGVMLVAAMQNGLNLLGISPYAFRMIVGAIILVATSTSGVSLVLLQVLSSGLNLLGANQHLSTATWGLFLIAVTIARSLAAQWRRHPRRKD